MYAEERRLHILRLLRENKRVDVADLAEEMALSSETIRRDLREMEAEGLLKRTHGGAILRSIQDERPETPLMQRKMDNHELKAAIARKAASFVGNGDIVAMDNSSTVSGMLQFIPREHRITIVTNSVAIMVDILSRGECEWTCVSLGGVLSPHSNAAFGQLTLEALAHFRPNKLFMSCGALDDTGRTTEGNLNDSELKKALAACSQTTYLLADATKFGRVGAVNGIDIDDCDYLITNSGLDRQWLPYLEDKSVEVIFDTE